MFEASHTEYSTRYQAIPVLEYTSNLEKNMKKHTWEALCMSLLVNIAIVVQVMVDENRGFKVQHKKKIQKNRM